MKIKEGYILRKVADSNVVVAVGARAKEFNGIINLSESSAFIWKILEKGAEKEDLVEALLKEYKADREVVEQDVERFINKIKEAGLVE
ncbi:MAG: PqqD family protein [Clostridiales bacterium]|nr:PqqD family protein [Clostridiales bacterium]